MTMAVPNLEPERPRNPLIEEHLKDVGHIIKATMPPGWGFTVMMFDYETDNGSMFYLSSAQRDDMVRAMQEFMSKQGVSPFPMCPFCGEMMECTNCDKEGAEPTA